AMPSRIRYRPVESGEKAIPSWARDCSFDRWNQRSAGFSAARVPCESSDARTHDRSRGCRSRRASSQTCACPPSPPPPVPPTPPLIIKSLDGKDSFEFYCGGCHGRDARGHGPMADRLKATPPDLTVLQRRNGGTFPRDRVVEYVTNGDAVARAHGTSEMLPWGEAFRGLERSAARVDIRIANIVAYVQSLQAK